MHYFPLALPFLMILFFLFLFLVIFVEIGILGYAYESLGINRRYIFAFLLLSLLGSYVNIPVATLPAENLHTGRVVTYFGMQYVVPMVLHSPKTVIAINLGGALVPAVLSIYLVFKKKLYFRSAIAVAVLAGACNMMAHTIRGVGIAIPTFIPPLLAAAIALALSRRYAPQLAYVGGSLGTLIGADLMNLGKVRGMGAPVVSIGGAGTFDGIFLTGIVAVLLASMISRWQS